jgi:hypothetical protein
MPELEQCSRYETACQHVYSDSDLAGLAPTISAAAELWRKRCEGKPDRGSSVLGAGIAVMHRPKRCRKAREKIIIDPGDICHAQGSCTWEESVDEVLEFLKSNGVFAYYASGHMD